MNDVDRYTKIVSWSEEDNCFIGSCPSLLYGGCHGDDPKLVFDELCEIVAETIEIYRQDNRVLPPTNLNIDWVNLPQSTTTNQ